MANALAIRGVPAPAANLAAELGLLAFKQGYASWVEAEGAEDAVLEPYTLAALNELRETIRTFG